MNSSSITRGAKAPHPSSRPGTPSRIEPSEGSSSVYSTASRPLEPSPPFSAITRPTMYEDQYSWEYLSRDSIGTQYHPGAAMQHTFGQPRPLSYPYNTFVSDTRPIEQSSLDMPNHNDYVEPIMARGRIEQGFQLSPPYPLHDQYMNRHSTSGTHGNRSGSIRQPTAEDFLRPDHPLPAPPTEEYDSDQDLPVIEPDSFLPEGFDTVHANAQSQYSLIATPKRHHTTAAIKTPHERETMLKYKRSQSELVPPSHASALSIEPRVSEHHSTPVRVPNIGVDMYQPALGGSQIVPGVQRRNSKRDRVKRFMNGLNPFHRRRKFGRQQG